MTLQRRMGPVVGAVVGAAVIAMVAAGCSSGASTHLNTPNTSTTTGALATTTTVAAAALGVGQPRSAVPWAQVGPGWVLALWSPAQGLGAGDTPPAGQPTALTATSTLYLVDPAGGRYAVATFPPSSNGPPSLLDWSGDGRHALLEAETDNGGAQTTVTEVDLTTAAPSSFTVGATVDAGYTRPDGTAILLSNADPGGTSSLERVDLSGTEQLTYPTDHLGSTFAGTYLSTFDGTQLVLGTSTGLVLMGNDGTAGATLSIPGQTECSPLRWWDGKASTTAVVACGDGGASRLWLVPIGGGAPTALTAPLTGQTGPDLGDENAWQVPAGTFVQDAGACGYQYLAKLGANGITTPVAVPDVVDGSSVFVVGVDASALDLQATVACGGGQSLVRYDPGTNTSRVLLGPPVNGGGVIAAVPYPTAR